MATTMIRGAKSSSDLSTNRIRLSIADKIALLDPNANPFTLLSQKWGKIAIGSYKRSWITDVLRPEIDQINYGSGYTADDTDVVVDNPTYYAVGELWQVYDSGEMLLVTSVVTTTSTVSFTRNYTSAGAAEPGYKTALTDNDYLEFRGNANEEGATSPLALHTLEVMYDNYTQIQRTELYLTNSEIQMLLHGEQDLPYEVRKKGIEHARKIEHQHLFGGKPRTTTGTLGHRQSVGAGLWWFLRKYGSSDRVKSETDVTEAEFMTWLMHCFRYGSASKVLFAPPILLDGISRWAKNDLKTVTSDKTYGIAIEKWVTPHGSIAIVNHKMLEGPAPGTAGGNAFLLDMNDIKYCYLRGRDTAFLTGRQANDEDAKKQEYLAETTLQVKNFPHHGYLYGFTSTSN